MELTEMCAAERLLEYKERLVQHNYCESRIMSTTSLLLAVLATSAFASVGTVQASVSGVSGRIPEPGGRTGLAATVGRGPMLRRSDRRPSRLPCLMEPWTLIVVTPVTVILLEDGWQPAEPRLSPEPARQAIRWTIPLSPCRHSLIILGKTFTVQQDDGLVLTIAGNLVLNNPGPHWTTGYTGTYDGPTGNEPFTLEYAEITAFPGGSRHQLALHGIPEPRNMFAGALLLLVGARAIRSLRKRQLV